MGIMQLVRTPALAAFALAVGMAQVSVAAAAPITLGGMGIVSQWTDTPLATGEMPANPWGVGNQQTTDRVGFYVEYQNGLTGSATYSGLAGLWGGCCNIGGGAGITPDTETGFFVGNGTYAGLHGIDNQGFILPAAWSNLTNQFSGNFDLSFEEFSNSTFRANAANWGSVTITLYSSAAPVVDAPEPASMALLAVGIAGLVGAARRRERAAQG